MVGLLLRLLLTRIAQMASDPDNEAPSPYFSPKELAARWRCSRSTVDRIAARTGLTRLCLGEGKNGVIRFMRKEVEGLERSRMLKKKP